mmetsp:Transcript_2693/g.6756  ORF Transcript_2693/g.6756 Transcript_2693/m.6756 type:complete len:208 (-) Transcript_2693:29-652(-)
MAPRVAAAAQRVRRQWKDLHLVQGVQRELARLCAGLQGAHAERGVRGARGRVRPGARRGEGARRAGGALWRRGAGHPGGGRAQGARQRGGGRAGVHPGDGEGRHPGGRRRRAAGRRGGQGGGGGSGRRCCGGRGCCWRRGGGCAGRPRQARQSGRELTHIPGAAHGRGATGRRRPVHSSPVMRIRSQGLAPTSRLFASRRIIACLRF